jgi:hypothetical protein
VTPFDAVHPSTRNHIPVAVQHEIDLFFIVVVVRTVGAPRREVHDEETGDHVPGRNLIASAFPVTQQKLV